MNHSALEGFSLDYENFDTETLDPDFYPTGEKELADMCRVARKMENEDRIRKGLEPIPKQESVFPKNFGEFTKMCKMTLEYRKQRKAEKAYRATLKERYADRKVKSLSEEEMKEIYDEVSLMIQENTDCHNP